ncbi:MAG: RagB/SusD family nutrient uptake outer membrane protein [Pedobacter sp.]|nr:RagB/SusD family nutrient uptake outer membrane protein [Pedobacter sp.]MDQ8052240.1 RagB/SusD family nutrient uptake outer membrane protein [Pedobacter sp.]
MKIKYIALALFITLGFSSCEKFLDKPTPKDTLDPDAYFNTPEQLDKALRGVYDVLQSGTMYRTNMYYLRGWEADEGFTRGNPNPLYTMSNEYNSSTSDILNLWTQLYIGVSRANTLIANVDKNPGISVAIRNQVRGEALFLRGYYYYLLVAAYGGVPLYTEPLKNLYDTDKARATDVQVYTQIVKDMTEAEALVPKITTLGYGGRVNKSAVRGILARVCLGWAGKPIGDASKYVEARKWAKMVIDDAEAAHTLNPSYADVFIKLAQDKYDIKESLWEVEFTGNGVGLWASDGGNVGYNNGALQSGPTGYAAISFVKINANLYDSYAAGDMRKGWNCQNYALGYNTVDLSKTRTYPAANLTPTVANKYSISIAKWRREYDLTPNPSATYTCLNFQILRYSDVLLMFAEAENQINGGPTTAAVDAVNLVRRRAYAVGGIKSFAITNGGTGYTTAPTVVFTGTGTAAIATATVSGGKVTALTLAPHYETGFSYGKYTAAPVITFTGGGGTGAVATATLYTNADADMPNGLSKDDFLTFIQAERSRELCFEQTRKFDLVRWGIYVQKMQAGATKAIADGFGGNTALRIAEWYGYVQAKHNLFPIPAQEMINNRLMTQNPGWN